MKLFATWMFALLVLSCVFAPLTPSRQTMIEQGEISYALRTADASRLPANYAKLLHPTYDRYAKK